jgi:SsrA-binding protein
MKEKIDIQNRKASYDYFFIKSYVAGIQLVGSEVKSIREGKVSLVDAYCYFKEEELYIRSMNISILENAQHDPLRDRKLLLTRHELESLRKGIDKGVTIIVKRIFSNPRGLIKAEIALAKGKKNYDKRQSIKERETKREINSIK